MKYLNEAVFSRQGEVWGCPFASDCFFSSVFSFQLNQQKNASEEKKKKKNYGKKHPKHHLIYFYLLLFAIISGLLVCRESQEVVLLLLQEFLHVPISQDCQRESSCLSKACI